MQTEESLTFVVQSSSSSKWMSPPKSPAQPFDPVVDVVAWLMVVGGGSIQRNNCPTKRCFFAVVCFETGGFWWLLIVDGGCTKFVGEIGMGKGVAWSIKRITGGIILFLCSDPRLSFKPPFPVKP